MCYETILRSCSYISNAAREKVGCTHHDILGDSKNCAKNPLVAPLSENKNQQWFQPANML